MTVQELYKRFLLMINKNDTNAGVSIAPGVFVLLYNAEQLRWLQEALKKDSDDIDSNLIELLFISDYQVTQFGVLNKVSKFIEYDLPDNFFQVYGGYLFADRGICKNNQIWLYEKKPGNNIPIRSDENSIASFDYQEAPFFVGQDRMKVYFDDFIVKKTFINYYRTPRPIDMEGYTNFDGQPSVDVNPELDDYNCLQILARVAEEVTRETEDLEGLQVAKDRVNTEF